MTLWFHVCSHCLYSLQQRHHHRPVDDCYCCCYCCGCCGCRLLVRGGGGVGGCGGEKPVKWTTVDEDCESASSKRKMK
uniref:Uncharacterized protein n=1 Tax=Octopus bimaculoides TaxID=37653 RepID=A0A0L8G435_OCTBM